MNKLCDVIANLAAPVAERLNLTIWDVEFVKEGGEKYLRVYIDKDGTVDINDCESFSRAFDKVLDEEDPIAESYIFEVSSAGLERRLYRPSDFETYMGSSVTLKTFSPKDGKKEFWGTLSAYNDGDVTIASDGGEITFAKKEIASVRLRVEF
ncbi:MAG: ribosome maturation factor RimP [Oscillospiraceae bacterium]|nr:ribosome maturation factor RimP [Oscillospiraceae bacterium]